MHIKVIAFAALFAALAPAQTTAGQSPTKVFDLTNKPTPLGLQEIGAIVRTIGDIRIVSLDPGALMVTVQGTSEQLALSGWLIQSLDVPARAQAKPPAGIPEYRTDGDGVVKVFYLATPATPPHVQEILTVLRTVVGVQKAFAYTSQNALVVRGSADEMALVEKLVSDLDKPRATKL